MLSRITKIIDGIYSREVSAVGVGVFRILYGIILLFAAIQNMYFIRLLTDDIPFLYPGEIDLRYAYFLWIIVLIFLVLGLAARYAAIANYILIVALFGSLDSFAYPLDYIATILGLLIIFIPTSQALSLDRLIYKLKYSSGQSDLPPPTTSQLNYFVPIFFGIGIVYLFSVPGKLVSPMWLSGLGVWIPASIPYNVYLDLTPLLNQKYLMKFLGYTVLLYEFFFVFVFYRKKLRLPLFIVGFGIHFGILIALALPAFALLPMSVLILLIPLSFWRRVGSFFKSRNRLHFYYHKKCYLCRQINIIISHFDLFDRIEFSQIPGNSSENSQLKEAGSKQSSDMPYLIDDSGKTYTGINAYQKTLRSIWFLFPIGLFISFPGIGALVKFFYLSLNHSSQIYKNEDRLDPSKEFLPRNCDSIQIFKNTSWKSIKIYIICILMSFLLLNQVFMFLKDDYSVHFLAKKLNIDRQYSQLSASEHIYNYGFYATKLFGSTAYGLFIFEHHWQNYDHLVTITYTDNNGRERWLPLYQKDGLIGIYNIDRFWGRWTYRSVNRNINRKKLTDAIKMYSAFWALKNNIPLADARFNIKVKVFDKITDWEKDYLTKQLRKEWKDGGYVEFKNNEYFDDNLKNIEAIR